ncbi:MAG: hypothetical protein ABIO33_03815, partial [Leifsonia sp.]
ASARATGAEYLVRTEVSPPPPAEPGADPPVVDQPAPEPTFTEVWVAGGETVPVGAVQVRNVAWTVTFDGASQTKKLQPYSGSTPETRACGA